MFLSRIKTLLLIGVLLFCGTMSAGWWRTYGGEGGEDGYCVQETSDGNYVISGEKDGDVWVLKVDTLGEIIWSKVFEGTIGKWVEETSDGGYVIAGTPDLLKVDAQGDSLWAYDYGIWSYCVQETSDGGFVVSGSYDGKKAALVKTDANGEVIWEHSYGDASVEGAWGRGYFVRQASDGGYIITGEVGIETELLSKVSLWLIKADFQGDSTWAKTYGGEENQDLDGGRCVRETKDNGYIVTGQKDYLLWLLKTDSLGDTLWTRSYSSSDGGLGLSIQNTSDSGYVITGITTSALLTSSPALNKLWLLKTNSLGDTSWTRIYGGNNSEAGRCVDQTSDKGYIITGYTSSFGLGNLYLLKTDSLGLLAINENPITERHNNWEVLTILGREIVLKYWDMPQGFNATIFDAAGRRMDELHHPGTSGKITWGNNYPSGVYFIQVNNSGSINTNTKRIILIR